MKGVVFTEFVEMVEQTFSCDLMDELFDAVSLESGGVYTSVGTYDHGELLSLVVELSRRTNREVSDLLRVFGRHLLTQFAAKFPAFFEADDAFHFLEQIEGYIHVEVRKLYADAELPHFTTERLGDDQLAMVYLSERPFADLAHGLIDGAIDHFGGTIEIERESTANGARFLLKQCREASECVN